MPPNLATAQLRESGGQPLAQGGTVGWRPNVVNRHAQELVSRIAVLRQGGRVDGEKRERFQVEDPHRLGVVVKEQAIALFVLARPVVAHRRSATSALSRSFAAHRSATVRASARVAPRCRRPRPPGIGGARLLARRRAASTTRRMSAGSHGQNEQVGHGTRGKQRPHRAGFRAGQDDDGTAALVDSSRHCAAKTSSSAVGPTRLAMTKSGHSARARARA